MCDYCNFGESEENEYYGSMALDMDIKSNGTKQNFEIYVHEDYEYDHFIHIDATFTDIFVPIKYCPKCGRKL